MSARLYVGNLNPRTSETQLKRFFSSAGMVVSVSIPVDRQTGQARGFAFVEFRNEDQAEQALAVFDGRELGGRKLRLAWARSREERGGQGSNLGAGRDPGRRRFGTGPDLDEADEAGRQRGESDYEDYTRDRRVKSRRRGKHGSDRRRGRGTQRRIE